MVKTPFNSPILRAALLMAASRTGWSTHLDCHIAQGTWTPREARLYISLLELRVVHLVCKAFLPLIRSVYVQIMSDNITTVVYINKQGGMRSDSFCLEAIRLWNWCITNHTTI